MLQTDKDKSKIIFIHANGFPPNSYNSLFNNIDKKYFINNFLLRPLWPNNNYKELKDWTLFQNDFIDTLDNQESVIGLGHSIGGNIILRTAISNPEKFSKIVLLDPTLFIPKIIYGWIVFSKLGLQNKIHPWINLRGQPLDNLPGRFPSKPNPSRGLPYAYYIHHRKRVLLLLARGSPRRQSFSV